MTINNIMIRPGPSGQTHSKTLDCRFAVLGAPERIWAIPSIHADIGKLNTAHENVFNRFRPGDRLIYLGNYTGYGRYARETINALLSFRRCLLSIPGVKPEDIVYLRGTQEEMWQKLLQLQFAPNPKQVLEWMLCQGVAQTLESYGVSIAEAQRVTCEGVMRLARWTENLRYAVYKNPGHDIFGSQFKRAAYTDCSYKAGENADSGICSPLLFVNAGIDCSRSLEDQGDRFWWGDPHFKSMTLPYAPFRKVIRGYDPESGGLHLNCVTATLDNNCGRGGSLVFAEIASDGEFLNVMEA